MKKIDTFDILMALSEEEISEVMSGKKIVSITETGQITTIVDKNKKQKRSKANERNE